MLPTPAYYKMVQVSELSRFGRSTLQILEIMKEEEKERGVAVHAVKGGWSLNGSMESKIVLMMFAMISEIERDLKIEFVTYAYQQLNNRNLQSVS